jgi:predicted  nucleic acid-binding Zn-ribbon protein
MHISPKGIVLQKQIMKIKNKTDFFLKQGTAVLLLIVFTLLAIGFFRAKADSNSITDISDTQSQIDELNRKAKIYQQIIDIKQQQGATLNNQLSIMDSNAQQMKSQIQQTESQISDINDQITQLQQQIDAKNDSIASQKIMLSGLVEMYYEYDNQDPAVFFLNQNNSPATFSSKDQLSQLGDKVREIADSLSKMRDDLQSQSSALNDKKNDIVTLHDNLQSQNDSLQNLMDQKQVLLDKTQGEEAQYQQLLQNVELQKQQLMDIGQYFASSGISISNYPTPPASLDASTNWFYYQWDSRWANNTIGVSDATMAKYGCAVTSVAMVLTEHGYNITPGALAKEPMYTRDGLISWPTTWPGAKLTMSSSGMSHGNVNWSVIDQQLAKGNPVIVHINKTNGAGGHYVVIHHKDPTTGKYVVHDPYFGPNIYLDTSRAIMGAIDGSSATTIDQMIIYN